MLLPPTASAPREPFSLLTRLHVDPEMHAVFSEERSIADWLAVECALAEEQAALGHLSGAEAVAVTAAAETSIDRDALWSEAANVGYPILGLVRAVAAAIPDSVPERVHYGATTQDIMDTALALALRDALGRLQELVDALGEELASLTAAHRGTVMPGRTHAQQAVPTTLGAKVAVFVAQLARHRERLHQALPRIAVVSLHGAGGTSAALGPDAAALRARVAARLGLAAGDVPWHVARDGVLEFGQLCVQLAATAARLAREVIDLSRTEIGELSEASGHHRGASSTMPQKRNPIGSEAVVGLAVTAQALATALPRAAEAGHERAAGEWQVEWHVIPQVACLTAAALREAAEVVAGLHVDAEAMQRNLLADGGLIMAEAYMIALAPALGRQRAHDVVYEAAQDVRLRGLTLEQAVRERCGASADIGPLPRASDYVGCAEAICDTALATWRTP
ncbi:MAG TPA: lyase family protein [Baekduia sp.]|uniref:lyase family protein n=1 Tax=Baekduia sp. TaxID=2600305 RepID=UPI002BD937FE|nr:lyase family protein [Baekduia sp.]HMJ34259.1 lyase family protein [Baekduia sp.]